MCDYSLQHVKSRPAKVGEKLRTRYFNTGTRAFAAPEDCNTAVCLLPGTELAFTTPVRRNRLCWLTWKASSRPSCSVAILRSVTTISTDIVLRIEMLSSPSDASKT